MNLFKSVCCSEMSKNQWHNNTEYFILTNRDNFLFTKIHFLLFCKAVCVASLKSTDLTSEFVDYTLRSKIDVKKNHVKNRFINYSPLTTI